MWAWIALLAAGGVLAALVLLVFRDVVALLLVLACLLVAAGAAWFALTRTGAVRGAAVGGACAALVGGVIALIAYDAIGELFLFVAACVLFTVASRAAFRAPRQQLSQARLPFTSTATRGRSGTAVLLMNPRSGGGKVEQFDLVDEASRRGVEPVVLEPGDDLGALARKAARSAAVIGMAGGDGSQALVAQVAMEHGIAYVCVPAGTRNHLALDLGLNRNDVVAALDAFTDPVERQVDLAFVNERIFVNNASLGVYAEIVQSESYRDAKLETMRKELPELLGPRATPFDLRFEDPHGDKQQSAQLLLVSNNPYVLDRLGALGSRPRLDTGELGIVAVEIRSAEEAAELASLHAIGQVRRFGGWREWTAAAFEVVSGGPVAVGIDGESVRLEPPLRFRIAPEALRVYLPATAPGASVAALRPGLTRSGLRELWEIGTARR